MAREGEKGRTEGAIEFREREGTHEDEGHYRYVQR